MLQVREQEIEKIKEKSLQTTLEIDRIAIRKNALCERLIQKIRAGHNGDCKATQEMAALAGEVERLSLLFDELSRMVERYRVAGQTTTFVESETIGAVDPCRNPSGASEARPKNASEWV